MTCYFPNGAVADGLQPCNTTAGAVSSCCRAGDVCLSNGFCFSAGLNSIVRRGCTDRTFNSSACPHACITGPEASVDMALTPCGDYTYFCCGQDDAARTCCTLGNGTVLLAAGTAILPTATVTYTNTITGTGSLTTCLSTGTAATAALNDCQSTNHTIPIAAGLGAALGVVAITAVAFAVMWKQKSHRLKVLEETSRYTDR
ncbi:hypothetical protein NA56DRAFT_642429 [Hyaloscypha hepaticicola]|uniref:Mid2 domain-containing protein n=1 Tax=Hyaloscypha hepaticicola TaxID=2082293 RepID=A0A2J6QGR0_9HELO|nr:hypothetical protein NA56DRAFT_642429 [Hyaloscypha hepaticicola]